MPPNYAILFVVLLVTASLIAGLVFRHYKNKQTGAPPAPAAAPAAAPATDGKAGINTNGSRSPNPNPSPSPATTAKSDGEVLKIIDPYQVRVYPPAALPAANHVFTGLPYGNGRYAVTASSTGINSSPHNAFDDNTDTEYMSGDEMTADRFAYSNGKSTTTLVDGSVYNGGWIEIALPTAIYATKLDIRVKNTWAAPIGWRLLGKNTDASPWVVLINHERNTANYINPDWVSYPLQTPQQVSRLRFCCNQVATAVRTEYRISDMRIHGSLSL